MLNAGYILVISVKLENLLISYIFRISKVVSRFEITCSKLGLGLQSTIVSGF